MFLCLALLGPPAEQKYQGVAVPAELDPVARSDVDAPFHHSASDASDVGQVPRLHAGQGRSHLGRGGGIETVEPAAKWTAAQFIDALPDLDHANIVTLLLPYCGPADAGKKMARRADRLLDEHLAGTQDPGGGSGPPMPPGRLLLCPAIDFQIAV